VAWLLFALPVAFITLFYVYPLLSLLDISLRPGGNLDLSAFLRIASSELYLNTLGFTAAQAALSTGITVALALPCAFIFARYDFPGKSALLSFATLPFVLPTVVVAPAFAVLLGERGLLNDLLRTLFTLDYSPLQLERSLGIILIAHVFYNFAIVLRMLTGYWATVGTAAEEAARSLGAGEWALWRDIRLPLLKPALLSASTLVFIFCFTSFGVVLILGGLRFATIEVQIYYQAVSLFNLPLAAALSLVQIASMLLMLSLYTRTQRAQPLRLQSSRSLCRRPRTLQERAALCAAIALIALLLFAPLLALVWRSLFLTGELDLSGFSALTEVSRASLLFIAPWASALNSLRFALLATVSALILGLLAASMTVHGPRWMRRLDPLFMLPLATSAVTLGFGFIIALDEPPLNLRASWVIIPISHTLVALPFVMRSVLPSLRALPPALGEAAQTLGAAPLRRLLSIDLPLIARSLAVGAAFAFTVSMGEFGASLFLAQREALTMPVAIYRLLGDPGLSSYQQALALSVLLLLVCALCFLLLEKARGIGTGEF